MVTSFMRRFFSAIIPMAMAFIVPARAEDVARPFATTGEYVAYCSGAKLKSDCYGGYEAALVEVIVSKRVTNICAPSQSGGETDEAKYQAREALEISRYVKWLKAHPEHMQEDFRKGLGSAIVAVYGCK